MKRTMEIIDAFKTFILLSVATIMSYLQPIENLLSVVSLLYLLNLIIAIIADLKANSAPPNMRKFLQSIIELCWYLVFILLIFIVADRMNVDDGALHVIKGVVWLIIYFYGVNILKNARTITPRNKLIKVLYQMFSIYFIDKVIPWAKKFIIEQKNEDDDTK